MKFTTLLSKLGEIGGEMRSSDDSVAPIIIKRKKIIAADGHHGGAWKVAYADFVTAMMAFFMLMWLLNATTEKQRKGLADYFSPTISINRTSGGGKDLFGGDSVLTDGPLPHKGTQIESDKPVKESASKGLDSFKSGVQSGKLDQENLQKLRDKLMAKTGESSVDDTVLKHVRTRLTDVGLIIDIYDLPNAALFDRYEMPTNTLKQILKLVVELAPVVSNSIAIETHVSASPVVLRKHLEWKTSMERASIARQYMEQKGMEPKRINRMTGYADRSPIAGNPMAVRNSRVSIVFLRKY